MSDSPHPLSLYLDPAALRPIIEAVVAETITRVEERRAALPEGRLAYSEEEASRLLGLEPHVLRDERRRGRITGSRVVGRRIRYTRQDLLDYLMRTRTDAAAG
jgi:hypothetical protein